MVLRETLSYSQVTLSNEIRCCNRLVDKVCVRERGGKRVRYMLGPRLDYRQRDPERLYRKDPALRRRHQDVQELSRELVDGGGKS